MGLIVLVGELHWNRGLCIDNYGKGFVESGSYYSPCHKPYLETGKFKPDQGSNWYFWKLIHKHLSTSIITWSLYIIHLFINWYIVYSVQNEKEETERLKLTQFNSIRNYKTVDFLNDHMRFNNVEMNSSQLRSENNSNDYDATKSQSNKTSSDNTPLPNKHGKSTTNGIEYEYNHNDKLLDATLKEKYSQNLNWYNYSIFIINFMAYCIHLILTHTIYDGLAKDVSIWSSQASVLYITFAIFIFRIPLRGLFFGITFNETLDEKCFKKYLNLKNLIFALKKYHSYLFIWGSVYTFWYHPMEPLFGHLTGFSFIFLIFVQASLIYTDLHKNIPWTIFLECYFVFHSVTVAIQNSSHWKKFINYPILIYSITVIPMLIHYLYTKHYQIKNSPLWLRIFPTIFAFIFATLLRCVITVDDQECQWSYLSMDYLYLLIYYIGIPILMIISGIFLKLLTFCVTNNRIVLISCLIVLFAGLNWFCVYSQQEEIKGKYVYIAVISTMIIIQCVIAKLLFVYYL